jgi:hypothetical protein
MLEARNVFIIRHHQRCCCDKQKKWTVQKAEPQWWSYMTFVSCQHNKWCVKMVDIQSVLKISMSYFYCIIWRGAWFIGGIRRKYQRLENNLKKVCLTPYFLSYFLNKLNTLHPFSGGLFIKFAHISVSLLQPLKAMSISLCSTKAFYLRTKINPHRMYRFCPYFRGNSLCFH